MRTPLLSAALLVVAGCATPASPSDSPTCADHLAQIEALRGQVDWLTNRLNQVEAELVALNADGEFTSLTIDKVVFDVPGESAWTPNDRMLLCHVVEWRDFESMKLFTNKADKVFYLEAPGQPTMHATMGTGGVTGSSGTTRYAYSVLHLTKGPLLPGVEYTLRPRNEVEGYRWLTTDSLRVARAD